MLVTPSLSHCSNKYKLAREGEKDKGKDFFSANTVLNSVLFMYLVFSPHWGSGSVQSEDVCFASWSLACPGFPVRNEIIHAISNTNKLKGSIKPLTVHTLKTAETVWKEPPFFLAAFLPPAPPLLASLEQKVIDSWINNFSFTSNVSE